MLKINSLEIENVKKVRAFSLEPSPSGLTVIGGRNAQGKTSVLDAIAYAVGGEKRRPSGFRNADGLAEGRIEVRLSNGLVVRREGKNASLKVTDPTGAKAGQKLLDSLIEELCIDLPKFLSADAKGKAKTLLHTLGLEDRLEELDREERKYYDERTLQKRDADRKRKYAEELPEYPDAPDAPLDAGELVAEISRISLANERAANHAEALRRAGESASRCASETGRLRQMLKEAEEREKRTLEELDGLKAVNIGTVDDTDAKNALDSLTETNRRVQCNLDKQKAVDIAEEAENIARILSDQIDDVRARRAELLASVSMPLEGLSVSDGELVYNGQKWDCMSGAEQLRVAVAVCRGLKPDCGFVLLDKTEQFDLEQLKEFGAWLESEGMQAIATRVSTGDECTIIIEDGRIAGRDESPAAPEIAEEELEAF